VVEILVLGPVEVRHRGRSLPFSRQQERFILGVLALEVGRPISTDRLIDLVWGPNPPRSARAVLQTRVSELRNGLTAMLTGTAVPGSADSVDHADHAAATIESHRSAYMLVAQEYTIDAHVFLQQARDWRSAGSDVAARDQLRSAVGLWRGPVLGDLEGTGALPLRQALESARLTALEELFELELALGNHTTVADEILRLPGEEQARERLTELAMIAQFRSGRAADALRTFDRWRRWLDDELAMIPGDQIQETHRAILRNVDPVLSTPARPGPATPPLGAEEPPASFTPAIPHTLPPDIRAFAGRDDELARLDDWLSGSERVVSITGPPGVGKTALSLRAAHDLADRFPDGQLFADLRGADKRAAAEPHEILGRFLRALGVQSAAGASLDDQVDMYRTVLADRKVLVILDNVSDDAQIEPLIPPGPGNRVIVNGRSRLHGGSATRTIDLHVLDVDGSADLLKMLVGDQRVDLDPAAARDLIHLCGQLPLALRIVGARLRARPHWTVERLTRSLRDVRPRLDQFAFGHLDVRVSIGLSYHDFTADAKLLLCSMADIDLIHLSSWAAAALLDCTLDHAERTLDEIFDAHLADIVGHDAIGPHFQIHDLVRAYALEQSGTEEIAARLIAARQRLYGVYQYVAASVNKRVTSGIYVGPLDTSRRWIPDGDVATALARDPSRWFETERPHILTLIRRAVADGDDSICCALVRLTWTLFEMRRYFDDWLAVVETSYSAAEHSQNPSEVASVKLIRAVVLSETRRYDEGRVDLADAAAIFDTLGDRSGLGSVLANLGMFDRLESDASSALVHHGEAVSELAGAGDAAAFGLAARYLGQAHLALGHADDAEKSFATALDAYRSVGIRLGEAQVLVHQGLLLLSRGELDRATQQFEQALAYVREIGDLAGTAQCLRALAAADRARGDIDAARGKLTEALQIVRQPKPTLLERIVSTDLERLDEPLDKATADA
jgi:DNA-binding SARP family transcriptional activator/tetratricopeptide (TPR) repeat protein